MFGCVARACWRNTKGRSSRLHAVRQSCSMRAGNSVRYCVAHGAFAMPRLNTTPRTAKPANGAIMPLCKLAACVVAMRSDSAVGLRGGSVGAGLPAFRISVT